MLQLVAHVILDTKELAKKVKHFDKRNEFLCFNHAEVKHIFNKLNFPTSNTSVILSIAG